jgi:oligosaccharide repeat unit polymerase
MNRVFQRKYYLPFCLGLTLIGALTYKGTFVGNSVLILPLICSLVLMLCFAGEKVLLERTRKDLFEPDSLFFMVFFAFHFPYVALYMLGLSGYDKEVFYNPDTVPTAVYFCLFCLIAFLAGYGKPFGYRPQLKPADNRFVLEHVLLFSKILIAVCLLFFWVPLLVLGNAVFSDYTLLIDVGAASYLGRLFWLEQYLGVAGLAMYTICSGLLYDKFMSGPFKYLAIFYVLGFLIIGDRGGFVYMAVIPLVAFNMFQKKISAKVFAALLLIFMMIIPIIAYSRTRSIYDPFEMVRSYSEGSSESVFVSALNELGTTVKTVSITMHFVPDRYEYWWGSSYLYSLSLVFPNLQGMRTSAGTPGAWLTETAFGDLSKTHGRGGSIAMEAYRNFGFILGIGVFLLLGFAIKKAYGHLLRKPGVVSGVAYFSIIASVVLWVRNDSSLAPRTIIWSLVIAIGITTVIRTAQKKKFRFRRAR